MSDIIYKKGDLIEAAKRGEFNAIAHQCNCFCRMGRGIAPQIKRAFPEAWNADEDTDEGNPYKLGTYSKSFDNTHNITVYNLYGQFHWSKFPVEGARLTNYKALALCFQKLADDLKKENHKQTLGLPKLGAGLAKGDWSVIEEMIKVYLVSQGIEVIVYEL